MADHASDYHRGEMDIQEQVSTFHLVMGMTKWGSLALAAMLLFLVLWFCTSTGFLGAFAAGAIVLALGIVILREGKKDAH
ncbi:MAG: aa3-type cytochrome c oxidase subunit IV [Phenylobacterium sp.]